MAGEKVMRMQAGVRKSYSRGVSAESGGKRGRESHEEDWQVNTQRHVDTSQTTWAPRYANFLSSTLPRESQKDSNTRKRKGSPAKHLPIEERERERERERDFDFVFCVYVYVFVGCLVPNEAEWAAGSL